MEDSQIPANAHESKVPTAVTDFTGLYDIRPATPEDTNFILATFLRGLYYGNDWYGLIPKAIFMANYKAVAEALVSGGKTSVMVACLKEDKDVILGYSILSADFQTIHWVHVKSAWRKKGIARSLVPKHPTAASHLSRLGIQLMSKFQGLIFNPFRL